MPAPLRVGIIGAGQISAGASREFNADSRASLVALADPNNERCQQLADEANIPNRLSDGHALIARDDLDAVYVATPNAFHAEYAKAALEAGKHVLVDKPFALNLGEAQQVADAAQDKVLMLGMNQRFNPTSQALHARVVNGDLGEIYHAKAYWRRRQGIPKLGTWFGQKKLAGGGGLLDIGVHMLDLAMFVTNRFDPVSVSGQTHNKFGNRGLGEGSWGKSERDPNAVFDVDDFATAIIRYADGFSLTLDATWAIHQEYPSLDDVEVFGTEAGSRARRNELYSYAPEGGYTIQQNPPTDGLDMVHGNRVAHFIGACLGEHAPLVTVQQALVVQAVIDAIYESSRTGKQVDLPQFG
jgi:predicted dehydrogenase